jgi:hypothetical protein
MKSYDLNITITDGYLQLLSNLSAEMKLDLITKLTLSLKSDIKSDKKLFKKSFGGFKSNKTAEQLISEINMSRVFNRQIDSL